MAENGKTQEVGGRTGNKNMERQQREDNAWDEIPLTPTSPPKVPMSELSRQFDALREEQEKAAAGTDNDDDVDFRQTPALQQRNAARKTSREREGHHGHSRSHDQWPVVALSQTPPLPASKWICCNCQSENSPNEGDCWYCKLHSRQACCELVSEEKTK